MILYNNLIEELHAWKYLDTYPPINSSLYFTWSHI